MSVIIKGLTLPEEGQAKTITIYPDGTVCEPNWQWDTELLVGVRAEQLPPHGRLIDADILEAYCEEMVEDSYSARTATIWDQAYQTFLVDLQTADTVLEAEEGESK